MGGKITIINSSSEFLRIEVFSGPKDHMHHPPDNVIDIEPNQSEENEIETTNKFNQRIRFLYHGWHCIIAVKNEAKLFFSDNDAVNEKWTPKIVGKDESVIFKKESRNYICLRCLCKDDDGGNDYADSSNIGDSSSIDGGALGVGLASGAVAGVLAPTVVVAGVQAIGFGTAGIVAGSTAASMMSASAIASGGSVAAGTLVPILQSIGALGALASGPAVLVGGVAFGIIGGAVVGGIVISKKIHESLKHIDPIDPCWDLCNST